MLKALTLCLCLLLYARPSWGCINESPLPPVAAPSTWTPWYSRDDPSDGTDDETLTTLTLEYPSVCAGPSSIECRVKFLHTDHVTAGQSLATSCTAAGGLLCRNTDQVENEPCRDYEIRFECPSAADALPDPYFYWDMSTKPSPEADEPVTCDGRVSSVYANVGGLTGVVNGILDIADSFDSSDHLCALSHHKNSWLQHGSVADRCISEPSCCTAGLTITFWMKTANVDTELRNKFLLSTGAQAGSARGVVIHLSKNLNFWVQGEGTKLWKMNINGPDFPTNDWAHYSFIYEYQVGLKYYKNGAFVKEQLAFEGAGPYSTNYDDLVLFSRNNDPPTTYFPEGEFSNLKIFYKSFNNTEVQWSYEQETSKSKLLIHYLRKHSHDDSVDVELECLAKAGSSPTITWYRSDDGMSFNPVTPSVDAAIYESHPNAYRTRSVLVARHVASSSETVFACQAFAYDGSVSKTVTIPQRNSYWTPWLSADSPFDGDDRETLSQHRQEYDVLCKYPDGIQCRTVYGAVSSNESGQVFDTNCTALFGLECLGVDQKDEHGKSCYDYEVRYSCPEPRFYWTHWYDDSDPVGTNEDESFDVHKLRNHADLCGEPVSAECRVKDSHLDLIATSFVPEVPWLCNANGLRCLGVDNTGDCPDFEVRYVCPTNTEYDLRIATLQKLSHRLDPDLRMRCSAIIDDPALGGATPDWAWLDRSKPSAAVALANGGQVKIAPDPATKSSILTFARFTSGALANRSIVCTVRHGIVTASRSVDIDDLSTCELPIGVSTGQVGVTQITPSTVESPPFKVPGVNGSDPWVPVTSDASPTLDFDLGVDFAVTGVAIQSGPSDTVNQFTLYSKLNAVDVWSRYEDEPGSHVLLTDYSQGEISYTTLTPNITARYIRLSPATATISMRLEMYGCTVGESTLQILQLTKSYDATTDNFTFTCLAEHYPLAEITWLADDVVISPVEGTYGVSVSAGVFPTRASALYVVGFHPDNDSVEFTCKATAGAEVQIQTIFPDYSFDGSLTITGDHVVSYSSRDVMTCRAYGDDVYDLTWGRRPSNGLPFAAVQPGGRFLIDDTKTNPTDWLSTLTIDRFAPTDEGDYACLVNSDTARGTLTVSGKSGLVEGWTNATYDTERNAYHLECVVLYASVAPDVVWALPNGGHLTETNGRFKIANTLSVVSGNLTHASALTVGDYDYAEDDGEYVCSSTVDGLSLNLTLVALYAYQWPVIVNVTTPRRGQLVHFSCRAPDASSVYHADWATIAGNVRTTLVGDASRTIYERRTGGTFYLLLDIDPYTADDDGDYACSVNNSTSEAIVTTRTHGSIVGKCEHQGEVGLDNGRCLSKHSPLHASSSSSLLPLSAFSPPKFLCRITVQVVV